MTTAAMLKITKFAIYPQQFDRSLRNLVRWRKMGLLTAPTVKKTPEVGIRRIPAYPPQYITGYIILSQQPFD